MNLREAEIDTWSGPRLKLMGGVRFKPWVQRKQKVLSESYMGATPNNFSYGDVLFNNCLAIDY